jgi:hypothetical protein
MGLGDLRGRAKLDINNPSAQSECDRCGFWYNLDQLHRQFEWRGAALADTGLLVCSGSGTKECLDVPFEQNRTLILPPDPVPRVNARPSHDITPAWEIGQFAGPTTPGNQGFTQYVLGAVNPPNYPTTKAAALAAVAAISGVPTPAGVIDRSVILGANTTVQLMAANPARSYLLVYSPVQPVAFISEGTALLGVTTNLAIGPGQAWFQATALQLGMCYQGALTAIGLTAGMNLFAWEF